jgi:dienelactone hydrolase
VEAKVVALGGSARETALSRVVGLTVAALLIAGLVAISSVASVRAAGTRYRDPIFSSVRRDVDLIYGAVAHSDGSVEPLKLDLYRPIGDTARNRPVVIYVHGGDNVSSPKEADRNQLVGKMYAKRGFVGAVINYRSGTDGTSQAAAWDLRAAVRWFRKNASAFHVSPNRIIVMGCSAGATAALSVTFDPDDVGNSGNPGYSSAVQAGISLSGTATDHTKINAGDPPIAMIVAKDDHPFYEGTVATCNETRAYGNVCEDFYYASGGHPPQFWLQNSKKIIEQASGFICRNVIPTLCH